MSSLNFNKVFIAGRMTANPELKTLLNSQKFVTSFDVAVNTAKDVCYFIPCVAWEQKAEFICTNFRKGSPIFIEGEMHSRKYTDKDGKNRTAYEVKVTEVKFCESKEEREQRETAPAPSAEETPAVDVDLDEDALPF